MRVFKKIYLFCWKNLPWSITSVEMIPEKCFFLEKMYCYSFGIVAPESHLHCKEFCSSLNALFT